MFCYMKITKDPPWGSFKTTVGTSELDSFMAVHVVMYSLVILRSIVTKVTDISWFSLRINIIVLYRFSSGWLRRLCVQGKRG